MDVFDRIGEALVTVEQSVNLALLAAACGGSLVILAFEAVASLFGDRSQ